jgi:CheY-like chemotaxis protein
LTTLLCVDDHRESLYVRRLLLESHGYRVLTADTGEQAMNLFHRHHPDVVVVDQRMPGLSGLDVARNMRRTAPDVPIILLSGFCHELPADVHTLVNAVVQKGDAAASLLDEVRRLAGKPRGEFRMPDSPERVLLASRAQAQRARETVQRTKDHLDRYRARKALKRPRAS